MFGYSNKRKQELQNIDLQYTTIKVSRILLVT